MQENRYSLSLYLTLLSICLFLGIVFGVLPGCSAKSEQVKEERLIVDGEFQNELLSAGASEFVAKAMFEVVRLGGKEELCLPFSWSFARVETCKPGVGLILKQ